METPKTEIKVEICETCKKIRTVAYICNKCSWKTTVHEIAGYSAVICISCRDEITNIFHSCRLNPNKREKKGECLCPITYLQRLECNCK
jgi:hypothetical protein